MGLFRLLLAFCVVLAHAVDYPIPTAASDVAVQAFYMVSGFFMAMVLTEKYHSFSLFFTNRLLRLYPAYAAVALVTIAHSVIRVMAGRPAGEPGLLLYQTHFLPLDWWARLYVIGTNALLWGQDLALFLKFSADGHSLEFTSNFHNAAPYVERLLLLPAAWSLSIELGFYVLAPWLVRRRTRTLVALLVIALAARAGMASIGLAFDPWTYRFFPLEIGTFVAGILSFRSMTGRHAPRRWQTLATAGLLCLTLTLSAFPGGWLTRLAFMAYCAWALPFAFQLTRTTRLDRYLGELSYPVYLCHMLVISVALYSHWSGPKFTWLVAAMTLASAIALHELVQRPVDRFRQRRVA